jgi:LmbE family N-acetylglucosaminyl deacetylase
VRTRSRFSLLHFISTLGPFLRYTCCGGFLWTFLWIPLQAQRNLAGESEIRQQLDRLRTLGSVMLIGAHPDDENTALLAYFSRGRHMRTAYLSLTRGEGGQNLIGSEQGDALGVIRTEELLAARKIDGGEQFFTRAIDFGFSKTPEETLTKWPRDQVLGDVVWNIRRFRPDVIILRFSGTPRDGHGQHQASAILGREAFSVAADPAKYPEQLQWVQPWQARRLMYNVIAFTAEQEKEAQKMADRVEIDLGEYNPELGYSYGEIAGMSRSQHRTQAMGAAEQKGAMKNYLVTLAGDKASKDPFDGIEFTWGRVPGGGAVDGAIAKVQSAFVPAHPEQLLNSLADARLLIAAIKDPLAERKLKELDETIALCASLWLDAAADRAAVVPGGSAKVNITALVRVPAQVALLGVDLPGTDNHAVATAVLMTNQPSRYSLSVTFPDSEAYSQPYWLVKPKDGWLYSVPDPRMIGNPENPPVLEAHFRVKIAGVELNLARPVMYRYIDHIYGEMTRPLAIVPPVGLRFTEQALMFPNNSSRRVDVPVKANVGKTSGEVRLEVPAGWRVEPPSQHFELAGADQQTTATFDVTPPSPDSQERMRAVASVGNREISVGTELISYPHIPTQTLFPPAETKLVRADIQTLAHNVGYIMGAGDEEPDGIRQMGTNVTLLGPDTIATGDLSHFDAIVTGVRAWNVVAPLRANYQRLFDYVQNGGTLIVQYNVPEGGPFGGDAALLEHVGPLPIATSRDRVTLEDSQVTFTNPDNPLLHVPNEISQKDFEGWVQERGLYFASEWDPQYQTVLECHDPGETPQPGGELYLRQGKGVYIFSAYAWFRELPAGVPGAYRLFANMLSAGLSAGGQH